MDDLLRSIMSVLLVVLGFLLGTIPPLLTRRRRMRMNWAALSAEIEFCQERASAFLTEDANISPTYRSPLYRLSDIAFRSSFPALLAEAKLDRGDVYSLIRFYAQVQDLNRGLDLATESYRQRDETGLSNEYERNRKKAITLIGHPAEKAGLYQKAREVVQRHGGHCCAISNRQFEGDALKRAAQFER